MQLIGILDARPSLVANAVDRRLLERRQVVGGLRVSKAARLDGKRTTLLQGSVVEEGIGLRRDDLVGQRRGLTHVARHQALLAVDDLRQQGLELVEIHRLFETIANRLLDERMVRHLARPLDVLETGHGVREDHRQQVFGVHALQGRRLALPADPALHGQRAGRVPSPSHWKHGCVEEGLHELVAHALRPQIPKYILQWEAVRRPE